MRKRSIFVGWDPRAADAFMVTCCSIRASLSRPAKLYGLVLKELCDAGLYTRPTEWIEKDGVTRVIDELSKRDDYDGSMSTEFAISRFLVPQLAGDGLALFLDSDMLARGNLGELFDMIETQPSKALWCVKHDYTPVNAIKMDGQVQSAYHRKNWSSVMVFDCDHQANKRLTVDKINTLPGRDLHRFCWLYDREIGEIGPEWNWLVGHSKPDVDPTIVHFTEGVPSMRGHANDPHADEWRDQLNKAAMGALGFGG